MNVMFLFTRKTAEGKFAEISQGNEDGFELNRIIDKSENNGSFDYTLHLQSNLCWELLNKLHELDYGRFMTIDGIVRAKNKAYEMKDCELKDISNEFAKEKFEIKTERDEMMQKNLFFSASGNVKDFVELGISSEKLKNKQVKFETNYSYHYIKFGKVSLEFSKYLKPTTEFIEAVELAIESKDPKESFKRIIADYGQFVPTKVILGGRAYFKELSAMIESSQERANENVVNAEIKMIKGKAREGLKSLDKRSTSLHHECSKLIGGDQPDRFENFEEKDWTKSLKHHSKWKCIEYQYPIGIFQILSSTLRKRIISSLGKRILYSKIENIEYQLREDPEVIDLSIPKNISEMFRNKDADCNMFATVVDSTQSSGFFTCQILCSSNAVPRLVIHCTQRRFKTRQCKLKIRWMNSFNVNTATQFHKESLDIECDTTEENFFVGIPTLSTLESSNKHLIIGHHFVNTQGNKTNACVYSYCSKKNSYDKLPSFTFYTLVIPNYNNPNTYGTLKFKKSRYRKKLHIELCKDSTNPSKPKYVSLYSTDERNVTKHPYKNLPEKAVKKWRCWTNTNAIIAHFTANEQTMILDSVKKSPKGYHQNGIPDSQKAANENNNTRRYQAICAELGDVNGGNGSGDVGTIYMFIRYIDTHDIRVFARKPCVCFMRYKEVFSVNFNKPLYDKVRAPEQGSPWVKTHNISVLIIQISKESTNENKDKV
ncbi:12203_t:CDS:10 [Funneliformis mosseae]|uniref:12203_t:CDS:1 n=1 Tax=Funneliformis mosseae TaxID=27381 RepID=A0A9N9B411_FUNMO|nr:12203_t:CDS:10 [Funneliformis mosseae]